MYSMLSKMTEYLKYRQKEVGVFLKKCIYKL